MDAVAGEGCNAANAGLAARAPLDERLHQFQAVEAICLRSAIEHRHELLKTTAGHVGRRGIEADVRQARTGEERNSQFARHGGHFASPVWVPREVLVAEQRDDPAGLAKDRDDLVEQLLARIQLLAQRVERILAVLPDKQHGIHG